MSDTLTFVGDPHGQAQHIIESIKEHKPQAVCLLGDMCFDRPIEQVFASVTHLCKPHWIHGNHDTDNQAWFEHIFHSPWASQNLHTRIQNFAGIKVAGLGGVFRAKIWDAHTPPKFESRKAWQDALSHKRFAQGLAAGKRRHESSIWLEDYQKLYGNQADILLLHEAPRCPPIYCSADSTVDAGIGISRRQRPAIG